MSRSFSAIAILAAGAFLTVVHRAVLTSLLAGRLVRCKGRGADWLRGPESLIRVQ